MDSVNCFDFAEVKQKVLETFNKSEKDLSDDLTTLKNWLELQKHLPEMPSDLLIQNFLFINKFRIEKTKQKLDMYYSIRSFIPEMFDDKHPDRPHMQKIADVMWTIPLPYLIKDYNRVFVFKLQGEPDDFDIYNFFSHTFNTCEIRILEELSNGDILVYDIENLKPGHLLKMSPLAAKNVATILEKVYTLRIAGIHFINCPILIDKLLSVVKPLLTEKLRNRVHVHRNLDTLYEHIPKQFLPNDYGGDLTSLENMKDAWEQKFKEHKSLFDKLDKLRVDENLRPDSLKNDDILGYYGNFKKLDVD